MSKPLADYFTTEQLEQLKGMETAEVMDLINKMQKHHGNPVYVAAREMYEATQLEQIKKGAEKYPEPLNPASWTVNQLAQHAFDEAVDLTHYITALKVKAEALEKQLELFTKAYNGCNEDNYNLVKEVERWKNDCKEYAAKLDEANGRLYQASGDIARLDNMLKAMQEQRDHWKAEYDEFYGVAKKQAEKINQLEQERDAFQTWYKQAESKAQDWARQADAEGNNAIHWKNKAEQIEAAKNEVMDEAASRIVELEGQVEQLKQKLFKTQNDAADLQERAERCEAKNQEYWLEHVEGKKVEIEGLKRQVEHWKDTAEQWMHEVGEWRREAEKQRFAAKGIEDLKTYILQYHASHLPEGCSVIDAAKEIMSNLDNAFKCANGKASELDSMLEDCQISNEIAVGAMEEIKADRERLRQELKDARSGCADIRQQKQYWKNKAEDMAAKANDLERQLAEAGLMIGELKDQKEQLIKSTGTIVVNSSAGLNPEAIAEEIQKQIARIKPLGGQV